MDVIVFLDEDDFDESLEGNVNWTDIESKN